MKKLILKMKDNKSPGVDGIPSKLRKDIVEQISAPLPKVYNLSLQDLIRFNKIAIPNNKFQMASGQGSHWLIKSPTILSSMCSPLLSDICQFYF